MPRRRLGGAAAAFLFALALAHVSGATDERIVPDQDISDLSREEQIAYLILRDQLAGVRGWNRVTSEWPAPPAPMTIACVRVGLDATTHGSIDPSGSLLDKLRGAEAVKDDVVDLIPASACNVDDRGMESVFFSSYREVQSSRSAVLAETNVTSSDDEEHWRRKQCPGNQYWGSWAEGRGCLGLCGGGASFYDVGQDGHSIWLVKSTCRQIE